MARLTQFSVLVTMLRAELRRSTSVAVGVDDLPSLKQTLSRTQELLYDSYDWPHLRQVSARIALSAGQMLYDVPSAFNFDRIERAVTIFGGRPLDIERGIDFEDYLSYDSYAATPARADPVRKWDIRWTGTATQVEVWPIPASNTGTLQWRGLRKLRTLVNDSDPADLDDQLIVLFSAADLGGGAGNKDAALKLQMAKDRLQTLKANAKLTNKTRRIGVGGGSPERLPEIVVRVG